jgi:hypothetical protein
MKAGTDARDEYNIPVAKSEENRSLSDVCVGGTKIMKWP